MAGRSSDPLAAALLGERWVVRRRLPDGSATDVIGWIDLLDPASVRLVTPDIAQVIERSMIIAARRAPAAAGGPDPRRISARELQRHALPGWLAWHASLGEWTLRAGGGFTRRANSCHAVGDPGVPIEQAAEQIISFAVAHDIAPMAHVIDGSAEEHALRRLGWRGIDQPTAVLVSRLADFLADRPAEQAVTITEELEPEWEQMYQQSRPNSAEPAIVRMILEGNRPRAFAAIAGQGPDDHSELIAIARGHQHDDWLGLASIWTRPDHRRRGLAAAMTVALGHWAARQGARYGYMQVATVNEPAIAAYTKLGFVHHHAYRYLAATW
ncbi:MAG TPA: GNAT family N-acetyltransferase [Propionibacteriaceae bacterium]|nr:GNAT family N-acetyltransferase [Propionibacteriaceae bacterium]